MSAALTHSLAGPIGGLIAAAFGGGCIGGYGFAIRTVLKSAEKRLAEMKLDCERDRAEWRAERARIHAEHREEMQRVQTDHRDEIQRERAECERRIDRLELRVREVELGNRLSGAASVGDVRQEAQREASTRSVVRHIVESLSTSVPAHDALIDRLKDER